MLNGDASSRPAPPPPLHTPQTSYERAASQTPGYDIQTSYPTPYARPSQYIDTRSPGSGGYFAQSPHQNTSASISTPSAGTQGTHPYGQSPGTIGLPQTPRDSIPPAHSYTSSYVPSPSPSVAQPPTPNQYHQPLPPSLTQSSTTPLQHSQTLQSPHTSANTYAYPHSRQISPHAQFHPQPVPVTPLGPPLSTSRPSPQAQRPISQGYDHHRTSSLGSIASMNSRDHSIGQIPYPEQPHKEGSLRQYSADKVRFHERERSVESVSPKTIPKLPPSRQMSTFSQQEFSTPSLQYARSTMSQERFSQERVKQEPQEDLSPQYQTTNPTSHLGMSVIASGGPSPAAYLAQNSTPNSINSPLPTDLSPVHQRQPNLKRSASAISGASESPAPARKRLRRDEIPVFAQSARKKPIHFVAGRQTKPREPLRNNPVRGTSAAPVAAPKLVALPATNGHAAEEIADYADGSYWEPSITNQVPFEDLTRRLCDWIYGVIGNKQQPTDGAVFEIEAKIGQIVENDTDIRLLLPVETETVFNKDRHRGRTKFANSMNMVSHNV